VKVKVEKWGKRRKKTEGVFAVLFLFVLDIPPLSTHFFDEGDRARR